MKTKSFSTIFGAVWHRGRTLASHPLAPSSNLGVPNFFLIMLLRIVDATALNNGQSFDNVNRTHLVPTSGKLVPQKQSPFQLFFRMTIMAPMSSTASLKVSSERNNLQPKTRFVLFLFRSNSSFFPFHPF